MVDIGGSKMAVLSLNELKPNVVKIPLSSLVENCELVQLETREDTYISPWYTIVTDKYIGVSEDRRAPFKLFDRSGTFLCNVGSEGRGPGEYFWSPYDAIIDDQNELVYLAFGMSTNIHVSHTLGRFVKDIVAPFRLNKAKIFLSDGILTVVHMPFANTRAMALQFDVNTGAVLNEVAPLEHLIVQNFDRDIINTRNVLGIFDFSSMNSDTLYHFDVKNNMIRPAFHITYHSLEEPWMVYFQMTKDLLFTNVSFLEVVPNMIGRKYVPRALVATDLKNRTSSYITVVNDYYGNIPVQVSYSTFCYGHYVLNIEPETLMADIENRLAESSCTDTDRQILNTTLSTLKEGSNNVVFIGKLKSEIKTKLW
ncbi:MAG: 6-bladed beta-propeller [Bacteroidales bacterium]|nr:6-bladed beta-propeller [Bacteroidales bacterium]